MFLADLEAQAAEAAAELTAAAGLQAGQVLVIGCSTSEVAGARIGTAGSAEIAGAVLAGVQSVLAPRGIFLAVQCCEHLNRALVIENEILERYRLEQVAVKPVPHAGGAIAAQAMRVFAAPVVVEQIAAHAGLDIGATLIGMHLRRVAVPVRLKLSQIGQACVAAARTRPKYIGGMRAVYE